MEIKIQCDCGQKFKFDVEPVNGRMPYAITCPVCGADGTTKANAIIAQSVPSPPVAPGIRIARPQESVPVAQLLSAEPAESPSPPPLPPSRPYAKPPARPPAPPKKSSNKNWIILVLVALVVAVIAFVVVQKVMRGINRFREFAQAVQEAATNSASASAQQTWTLPDDDGTALLVKHTNEMDVAKACAEYWQQTFRKKMVITTSTNLFDTDEEAVYLIEPAWNNAVKLDGPLFWDEKQVAILEGLAKFVSRKLSTTTVSALMGDDAEGGVVTIFENGEKKFRCERHIMIKNGDLEEVVKVEGEAWAAGLGFKPAEGDFKKFTMEDANNLTHHIGIKTAGRPEYTSCIELKEPGRKQQQ